ncbi:MAG: GNAT family N-acetyltransferase [Lachnospiraceae bacterium]|nr:GNAT family N-acetyltransferase [Lachnospiraceae bacterium]
MDGLIIRKAEKKDVPVILDFIKRLAEYENLSNEVEATEESLSKWIFDEEKAEAVLVLASGKYVGFAVYFYNFSTFLGKGGVYIEDIFVKPEYRGKGYGKALFKYLAKMAKEKGCGRLEWSCLDWNRPSIDFYLSFGARPMDEWTIYRLAGEALDKAAE